MESNAGPPYPCRENLKAPYQESDQPNSQNHTSTYPPPMHSTIDDVAPQPQPEALNSSCLGAKQARNSTRARQLAGTNQDSTYLPPTFCAIGESPKVSQSSETDCTNITHLPIRRQYSRQSTKVQINTSSLGCLSPARISMNIKTSAMRA